MRVIFKCVTFTVLFCTECLKTYIYISNTTFQTYTDCDRWYALDPPLLHTDASRFGHSVQVVAMHDALDNSYSYEMLVFGGYSGQMYNDMLRYRPGML